MPSELSERYNEGLVRAPARLQAEAPFPRRPVPPAPPEYELNPQSVREIAEFSLACVVLVVLTIGWLLGVGG